MHRYAPKQLLRSLLSLAVLAAAALSPCQAGQASALFRVTMDLRSPAPGVACKSVTGNLLECRRLISIAPQQVVRSAAVIYRIGILEKEDSGAGEAVAASRRVSWGGRDYLEMTLTW